MPEWRCITGGWADNTDDRSQAGSGCSEVWSDEPVTTSCVHVCWFVPVDLLPWEAASGGWCAFFRALDCAATWATAFRLAPYSGKLRQREGLHVNHKYLWCLYPLSGPGVNCRRGRRVRVTERLPLLRLAAPGLSWSPYFVMDAQASWRRIKCYICVDDFTNEYLSVSLTSGISGMQVTRILDSIVLFHGYPVTLRPDQTLHQRLPGGHWTSGPLRMALSFGLFSRAIKYLWGYRKLKW